MRGYPKILKTKFDYLFVKEHFRKSYWQKDFQNLIDNQYKWFYEKRLEDSEEGLEDDTHKIYKRTTVYDNGNKTVIRQQYVYKEDPNCLMYQLGFTRAEIEEILQTQEDQQEN